MSRIFDALNQAAGEASDAVMRVVAESSAPLPPRSGDAAPKIELPAEFQEVLGKSVATAGGVADSQARTLPVRLEPNSPLLPFDTTPNAASEEYRIIRTKILQHPKRPRIIVVSSAGPADGKTVTAINLAGAISLKSDARALLLDADFRRSSIAKTLGLPATPGLAEVLTGKAELQSVIIRTEQLPNLHVIPAGECSCNPTELLDSRAWLNACAGLRAGFGYIILDSPPMQAVADYELIQAAADGVIVVVRQDHTKRGRLDAALKNVPPGKVIGVVMNCVSDWFRIKHKSYGYSY